MLIHLVQGLILLSYFAMCVFTVVWVISGGEMAAYKPASWVSKVFFWHGIVVLGALMLGGGLAIALTLGRLAWGP